MLKFVRQIISGFPDFDDFNDNFQKTQSDHDDINCRLNQLNCGHLEAGWFVSRKVENFDHFVDAIVNQNRQNHAKPANGRVFVRVEDDFVFKVLDTYRPLVNEEGPVRV